MKTLFALFAVLCVLSLSACVGTDSFERVEMTKEHGTVKIQSEYEGAYWGPFGAPDFMRLKSERVVVNGKVVSSKECEVAYTSLICKQQ